MFTLLGSIIGAIIVKELTLISSIKNKYDFYSICLTVSSFILLICILFLEIRYK